jgi:hypothetical protein
MDYECKIHQQMALSAASNGGKPRKRASRKNTLHTKDVFDYIAWQEFMHCRQSATGPAGDSVIEEIAAAQTDGWVQVRHGGDDLEHQSLGRHPTIR